MQCRNKQCRKKLRKGVAYCAYCGTKVKSQSATWLAFGGSGFVLLLLIGFVLLFLQRVEATDTSEPIPSSSPITSSHTPETVAIIYSTATATSTSTPVPTDLPTATQEPTATPTNTPVPTDTPEPTAIPTNTPEPTAIPTNTPEPVITNQGFVLYPEIIGRWVLTQNQSRWYKFVDNGTWIGIVNSDDVVEGTYLVKDNGTILELMVNDHLGSIVYYLNVQGDTMTWKSVQVDATLVFRKVE